MALDITIPRPQDLPYLGTNTISVSEHARILHSACRRAEPDKWGRDLKSEFASLEVIIRGWNNQEWTTCALCPKVRGKKLSESNVVAKEIFGTALAVAPLGCPEVLTIPGEFLGDNGEVITFPDKFVGCRDCIAEIKRQTADLKPAPQKGLVTSGEFAGYPDLALARDRAAYMDLFGPQYYLRDEAWYAKRERFVNLA